YFRCASIAASTSAGWRLSAAAQVTTTKATTDRPMKLGPDRIDDCHLRRLLGCVPVGLFLEAGDAQCARGRAHLDRDAGEPIEHRFDQPAHAFAGERAGPARKAFAPVPAALRRVGAGRGHYPVAADAGFPSVLAHQPIVRRRGCSETRRM